MVHKFNSSANNFLITIFKNINILIACFNRITVINPWNSHHAPDIHSFFWHLAAVCPSEIFHICSQYSYLYAFVIPFRLCVFQSIAHKAHPLLWCVAGEYCVCVCVLVGVCATRMLSCYCMSVSCVRTMLDKVILHSDWIRECYGNILYMCMVCSSLYYIWCMYLSISMVLAHHINYPRKQAIVKNAC